MAFAVPSRVAIAFENGLATVLRSRRRVDEIRVEVETEHGKRFGDRDLR
jgi:hypothetical protein